MAAKADEICCATVMELDKKMAVQSEKFDNLIAEMASNTQTMRDLTASISDYPVTRERVGNMWKIICGLIASMIASVATAVGVLIKGSV